MIMNIHHPEWAVFCDKLGGPDACDFQKNDEDEWTWKCKGGTDKTFATEILKEMGLNEEDVQGSLRYFEENGGHCDCEILLNVDTDADPDEAEVTEEIE
jgi:hypothetical protein